MESAAWDLLTRTVGVADEVEIDGFAVETAGAGAFLVCSDGLSGMVDDGGIARLLRAHAPDPEAACAALIEAALSGGGLDNVTVVVVYPRGKQAVPVVRSGRDVYG
jgi:protein phosphatase